MVRIIIKETERGKVGFHVSDSEMRSKSVGKSDSYAVTLITKV